MIALFNGLLCLGMLVGLVIVLRIIMKKATEDPSGEDGTEDYDDYKGLSALNIRWSVNDDKKQKNEKGK